MCVMWFERTQHKQHCVDWEVWEKKYNYFCAFLKLKYLLGLLLNNRWDDFLSTRQHTHALCSLLSSLAWQHLTFQVKYEYSLSFVLLEHRCYSHWSVHHELLYTLSCIFLEAPVRRLYSRLQEEANVFIYIWVSGQMCECFVFVSYKQTTKMYQHYDTSMLLGVKFRNFFPSSVVFPLNACTAS